MSSDTLHLMRRAAGLSLVPVVDPVVTVIIPVYGQLAMTLGCLESIRNHAGGEPAHEVIIVDDCSPDETAAALPLIGGVTVLRPPENQGFVRACNLGARHARGDWIVLLNNDTHVTDGWLSALLSGPREDPGIGVVGASLRYPDGRLQEAGGVIWNDADGWNFGRFDDPDGYLFRVRRDVDYCSGACLLVETSLWRELDGFDERYIPAYYEDTDLCFRAREAGRRVIYEPRCVIVHHEGITHGSDVAEGGKANQVKNHAVFADRWAGELERTQFPHDPDLYLLAARDRRPGRHIVIIDHRVPEHDKDSGSVRMTRLIELLVDEGWLVHFVAGNQQRIEPYTSNLEALGVEVCAGYAPGAEEYLAGLGKSIEAVVICRPDVGSWALPMVWRTLPDAKVIYDMVDAHGARERRRAELDDDEDALVRARMFDRLEAMLGRGADAVLCVTENDRAHIEDLVGAPIVSSLFGNIHALPEPPAPFDERDGLVFVGGYEHPPNVDAAHFLVEEVLPRVRSRLGPVPLTLAGSKPPQEVLDLAGDGVVVPGWIEDLGPLYQSARVVVAPLRYGAGMKGKIGESLSRGVPTVTTPDGVDGLGVEAGRDVLIGDDAEEIADLVASIYTDRPRWEAMSGSGRAAIEDRFGLEASRKRLVSLLGSLGLDGDPPRGRGSES